MRWAGERLGICDYVCSHAIHMSIEEERKGDVERQERGKRGGRGLTKAVSNGAIPTAVQIRAVIGSDKIEVSWGNGKKFELTICTTHISLGGTLILTV